MELIARIDCDGRVYVGQFGRDNKWVKAGNRRPVSLVKNELGGQDVSIEDIESARAHHPKGYNDWMAFAEDDVRDFWNNSK